MAEGRHVPLGLRPPLAAIHPLRSTEIGGNGTLAEPLAVLDDAHGVEGATTIDHAPGRRGWLLRRALVVADAVALALAIVAVRMFSAQFDLLDPVVIALCVAGLGVWVVVALAYGLYSNDEIQAFRSTTDDLPGLFLLTTLLVWVGLLFLNGTGLAHPTLGTAAVFWAAAVTLLVAGRHAARSGVRRRLNLRERTVIVGAGSVGAEIARKLGRRPDCGLEVVGFIDEDPSFCPDGGPPYLGATRSLESVLRSHRIERVIFSFVRMSSAEQVELFRRCMSLGVQVDIVPRLHEVIGSKAQVHEVDGLRLVGFRAPRLSRSEKLMKRTFDLVLAVVALIVTAPLFFYAAVRIKLGSEGPVFFRQKRIGTRGKPFTIVKFRTMVVDAEERTHEVAHLNKHDEEGPRMFKIPDDPRITPFGQFLRRWSLDELPQLFNVLRGEMSLVGPRPLILSEDENVVGQDRSRLWLTPGMTGLWQVLGRSDVPFAEMVSLDYLYVTNWSLWGDVRLLARTMPLVLRRHGAY